MQLRAIHSGWLVFFLLAGVMTPSGAVGGYALEFDGVDDYVDVPSQEYAFADGDIFTIEVWSRWYDTVRSLCAYRYQLERSRFRTRGSAELVVQTGITNQEWHHIAVVYNGSGATKYLTGYVDGTQTSTANTTGSPLSSYSGNTLRFGMTRHSSGQYSHCMMDEVRIWNIARTLPEIQDYMKRGLSGGEKGLIGYWTFDEGQGTTLPDHSPRGNNGTIVGASWTTDAAPVASGPAAAFALSPSPANAAVDVPRDVALGWKPGGSAAAHDVYFGTVFADVNTADRTTPKSVLVSKAQDANAYDPTGVLGFDTTYYWRVDEVNAPPSSTVIRGSVWSFTTEARISRVTSITATASSFEPGFGPENTINGSGLSNNLHSAANTTMWVSGKTAAQPTWIRFQFDQLYKLVEMRVWNYNAMFEPVLGFGFKDVTIEYSADGTTWTVLKEAQFARAPGQDGYAVGTTVDLAGTPAKFIRLTPKSNWGGLMKQYGLSEVRFYYVPVNPRQPVPATGARGVNENTVLSWRPGREAVSHQVYFGTDANAVRTSTASVKTVTEHSFNPGPLTFGQTYYWKVVEVNEAATPKSWEGDVWSFSTREAFVVEDFESYTDKPGEEVFTAWVDGMVNSNGSLVGYMTAANGTFGETKTVHGGRQSMPFEYNNVKTPYYSEAERTFDKAQDWTVNGADTLTVYFRGNATAFTEAGGKITMSGAGTDIWNNADQFRFAFKSLTGDGTIVAKVESIDNPDVWAKAGVMIRESLDPGSRFAAVYATPGSGVRFQARALNGGAGSSDTAAPPTAEQLALKTPVWLKIERKSTTSFSCFYSTDGVKWTSMVWNPQTINMTANTVYIGLAVTGHDSGTAIGVFSNVSTTGNVTGSWQVQAIGIAQPSNDAAPLYAVVQDSAGKSKVMTHPNPAATTLTTWQAWRIPLSEISAGGVKLTAVKKLMIGVGDRANPKPDGAGKLLIDDIGVGHPAATNP